MFNDIVMRKIQEILFSLFWKISNHLHLSDLYSDRLYISLQYRFCMHKELDLENPKTYNEKLQLLKLYDRNPLYTVLVDKYKVKEWVAEKCGNDIIIPTLGVWDNVDDIEWDKLPDQFVLKANHYGDNIGVVICDDKAKFNKQSAIRKLKKVMNKDYYKLGRERPYRNVKRKIIAEQYMQDNTFKELRDYKFLCFNGEVKILFIATGRQEGNLAFDYFDENFRRLPFSQHYPNSSKSFTKPKAFEEMKEIASKLSKGIPHVRVDLYLVNDKIYFGEMTFYHFNGTAKFTPEEWDYKIGDYLHLPAFSQS